MIPLQMQIFYRSNANILYTLQQQKDTEFNPFTFGARQAMNRVGGHERWRQMSRR